MSFKTACIVTVGTSIDTFLFLASMHWQFPFFQDAGILIEWIKSFSSCRARDANDAD